MAILITGGTGKTGTRMVPLLQKADIPFLIASRKGAVDSGLPATKFDWLDDSTFKSPFQHEFPNGEKITAVYLISPQTMEPSPVMNEFIDLAVQQGVKRFVLLSGTTLEKGGHYTGKVWSHLEELGVEYAVLKATWFNGKVDCPLHETHANELSENFSEWQHKTSIREESKIYSACEDGKVPFVSAADIAEVAFHALTEEKITSTELRIVGPEILSHDDVARIFSARLGREIIHVRLSTEDRINSLKNIGMDDQYAKFMTQLEVWTKNEGESALDDTTEKVIGRRPQTFDSWVTENSGVW